ncbi:MAG: hypothetical protein AB8B77_09180 [Alphaproteobacteria bacterium]
MKIKSYATDIWHVGIINAPIDRTLKHDFKLETQQIIWLPQQKPFCFIADPFGIKWQDQYYIFVEYYDFKVKIGEIHCYQYSAKLEYIRRDLVLKKRHHLSYPYIFQDQGTLYMLPEMHKNGVQRLYRAVDFPYKFEACGAPLLPYPIIDPALIFYQDRYWLFYTKTRADEPLHERANLYAAYADHLEGPYIAHDLNPIRTNLADSRMGGTPFIGDDGALYLPMQDCTIGYGEAINILRINQLTPDHFDAQPVKSLSPSSLAVYHQGMHTLSACGDITLIDAKYINQSSQRRIIDLQRKIKRTLSLNFRQWFP